MMAFSSTLRPSISSPNDDFFVTGPLMRPPNIRDWNGARLGENGLRELNASSLKPKNASPRNLSVPGLVKGTPMRPNPIRSNSAEYGF